MSGPIVGIDLGTATIVVAAADASGAVQVLADDGGARIVPSVVSLHPRGDLLLGAAAKQRKAIDPANTIGSIKRLLGRSIASPEVAAATRRMPYTIRLGLDNRPTIPTRIGDFDVPALTTILLDHARAIAARRLGEPVQRAVLAVPASFDEGQRAALTAAANAAGLTVVRLIDEPVAAALGYAAGRAEGQIVAVYDFGAGAFDVTIVRLRPEGPEVLATAGHGALGGDDLDEQLVDLLVQKIHAAHRLDLRLQPDAMLRLRGLAEQTKIELSRRTTAAVRLDGVAQPDGTTLDLQLEVTRDELSRAIADLVERTLALCDEALRGAGLTREQLADVVLVGGTTKLPLVREQVARHFGRAPRTDVNPEDVVARGAALHARAIGAGLPAAPPAPPLAPILERAAPRVRAAAPEPAAAPAVERDEPLARAHAREAVFAPRDAAPAGPAPAPGAIGRLRLRKVTAPPASEVPPRVIVVPPPRARPSEPPATRAAAPPSAAVPVPVDALDEGTASVIADLPLTGPLDGLGGGTGLSETTGSEVVDLPLEPPPAPRAPVAAPVVRAPVVAAPIGAAPDALDESSGLSQLTGLSQTTSSVMIVDLPLDAPSPRPRSDD